MVHDAVSDELFRLDRRAELLWEAFDGRSTIADIVGSLTPAAATSVETERLRSEVSAFAARMLELGLFEVDATPGEE